MPTINGLVDFDPKKDIPSLEGKVILVTGGTAGLGTATISHLLEHNPEHIYFTGRNVASATSLIETFTTKHPSAKDRITFIPLDLSSLTAIVPALKTHFKHTRLDILILNAGIMGTKAQLSPDGYEIHFATNHLGHAAVLHHLLPTLLATTRLPGADVRVISLTSLAFEFHPKEGIAFEELDRGSTFRRSLPGLGGWTRYGQSKLANILYASALAKRHPEILSVSLHPGVVETPIVETMGLVNRTLLYVAQWMQGNKVLTPEEGSWNTVWAACVAERSEVRNGGFYMPVGVDGWDSVLDQTARDEKLADQLWEWTLQALEKAR